METIIFILLAITLYFVYDTRKRIQNIENHVLNLKEEVKKQNTPDVRIGDDELFEKAKQLVIEAGKASTSFLQRKLGVGYSRASSLIDSLEAKGIVQSAKGSNPRSVNPTAVSKPKIRDGKKHKILLIDDDEFLLNLYRAKFEQNSYTVFTMTDAGDGNGGFLENVNKISPDLIITNINMPGRDGFEAISLLKNDNRTKNIPIFVLTTMGAKEDIERGMNLGVTKYWIKVSMIPSEIVSEVQKFFDK